MSSINWVDELSGTVSDVHLIVPLAAIKPFHAHTLTQAIDISRSVLKQIIEALEVRRLSLAIPLPLSLKIGLGRFTTIGNPPPLQPNSATKHARSVPCYCVNIVYTVGKGRPWQNKEFIRLGEWSLFVLMKRRSRGSITFRSARGARVGSI